MSKSASTAAAAATDTKPAEIVGPSMSKAQQKVVDGLPTVSARIRYLASEGFTRSETTKLIPNAKGDKLLYQHVRNVLTSAAPAKAD